MAAGYDALLTKNRGRANRGKIFVVKVRKDEV